MQGTYISHNGGGFMYDNIIRIIEYISSAVWGMPTVILLVGTGIYLSIKLKFFQFLKVNMWIRNTVFKLFTKKKSNATDKNSLSAFQAISTALASTIGTGNIAGVATAISVGGPGAVLWMWVSAFFGMMTSYSENVLGIYYRKKNKSDEWNGGPLVYINEGLKNKKGFYSLSKGLTLLYGIFLIGASLGIGNMVQTNSISESVKTTFHIPAYVSGAVISIITYIIISGGLKRIGSFTEKTVPIMALFYITTTLYIFLSNFENIQYVFTSIFKSAFSLKSATGALCGEAVRKSISVGFKRGVFSNEAGLGASTTVSSCSELKEPCEQGMWGIFGVFTDTIIICTLTAFALLSTTVEAYNINYALNNIKASPMYVYISEEKNGVKEKVPLTDTNENNIYEINYSENNSIRVNRTNKKTYTNIMKLTCSYDDYGKIKNISLHEIEGVSLVSVAFEEHFGKFSSALLSVSIVLFSFSTVIGWYFYGKKATEILFGSINRGYNILYATVSFIGSIVKLTLVWTVSDIFNALLTIPNLTALLLLSNEVKRITENYLRRKKGEKLEPLFSAYEDNLDTNFDL